MAQSSIEWLVEELDNAIPFQNIKTSQIFREIIQQAKEMHKQEIEKAWYDIDAKNGEIYYNKKFNK